MTILELITKLKTDTHIIVSYEDYDEEEILDFWTEDYFSHNLISQDNKIIENTDVSSIDCEDETLIIYVENIF